jgi:hypothetical protein
MLGARHEEEKLCAEKGIGGQNYGNAVSNNTSDVEKTERAVWATYFHQLPTDENSHGLFSQHTRCKYNTADTDMHHGLPEEIMLLTKPVYR